MSQLAEERQSFGIPCLGQSGVTFKSFMLFMVRALTLPLAFFAAWRRTAPRCLFLHSRTISSAPLRENESRLDVLRMSRYGLVRGNSSSCLENGSQTILILVSLHELHALHGDARLPCAPHRQCSSMQLFLGHFQYQPDNRGHKSEVRGNHEGVEP